MYHVRVKRLNKNSELEYRDFYRTYSISISSLGVSGEVFRMAIGRTCRAGERTYRGALFPTEEWTLANVGRGGGFQ